MAVGPSAGIGFRQGSGSTSYMNRRAASPAGSSSAGSTASATSRTSGLGSQLGSQLSSLLGGGGSAPGGPPQAQAVSKPANPAVSYSAEPFSVSSQENPQMAALIGDMGAYRGQLAGNTDLEATQALQRQRDLTSGMAEEFGVNPAMRGIGGSGAAQQELMKRVVEPGQQQMSQLNAQLASDARTQQREAMGQQAGMVGQQAGITQAQQDFGLNAYQARQQAQLGAAQLEAMQRNNNTNNALQLASLIFSGF